jgi:hypothetical protein
VADKLDGANVMRQLLEMGKEIAWRLHGDCLLIAG